MHFAVRLLVLSCLALAGLSQAEARRVALVIGNSDYRVGPLQNPRNDATAVADLLGKIGFDKVMLRLNLGIEDFRAALLELSREAAGAEVGVVYFAGHGTEVHGRNFLIPVDAKLARAGDLDLEGVALDAVLNQLAGVSKLKLVILDACRNNIFPLAGAKRATTRGLARIEPDDNTLIAYAAKDGTTADDGAGDAHSPFTAALLKHMATPGLDIRLMLGKVRDHVLAATRREQQPFAYGSLTGEVVALVPGGAAVAPSPPPVEVPKVEAAPQSSGKGASPTGGLFTAAHAKRLRAIAAKHGIPLPQGDLKFVVPKADVPAHLRSFVGVWADELGPGGGKGRKYILIITSVSKEGLAEGFWAWGPPTPDAFAKGPAGVSRIAATIAGDTLKFSVHKNHLQYTRASGNRLSYFWSHESGRTSNSVYDPLWTLAEAERGAPQ